MTTEPNTEKIGRDDPEEKLAFTKAEAIALWESINDLHSVLENMKEVLEGELDEAGTLDFVSGDLDQVAARIQEWL